jgi:LuxR family maltose regulon positive regulatory protein
VICQLFLAGVALARGELDVATRLIEEARESAERRGFLRRLPEIAATGILLLLRQERIEAAEELARTKSLPLSLARVHLVRGEGSEAMALLLPLRREAEARGWADELLKIGILEALAIHAMNEEGEALRRLGEALAQAKPGGLIRVFVDEGAPMARLLTAAGARGLQPGYVGRLASALGTEDVGSRAAEEGSSPPSVHSPFEPLSARELEVLRLVAAGRSNQEIAERLFLALSTVKGHNQKIFEKLRVERRTEAVVRARALGLL